MHSILKLYIFFTCNPLIHPTLRWLKVSDDMAMGAWNWINNLSAFHIRLSFGDWLRPVVKGRGVGISRVFFVTFAVTEFLFLVRDLS
jgi:hypothetical protein